MAYGLPSMQEQLAGFRDESDSGVALVHIDTCLESYLQDHHNRPGEALFGIPVDGDSTLGYVRAELARELAQDDRLPDYLSAQTLDSALESLFEGRDLAIIFDVRLDSPPKEGQFDSEEAFDEAEREWEAEAGESCQAWFVLTWTDKPYVAWDIRDAAGHLVHNAIVTDDERRDFLAAYDDGTHVWTQTGRYSEDEADAMDYESRGLPICPDDGNGIAEDGICGFCGNAPPAKGGAG